MHDKAWETTHMGQSLLNAQLMKQTCSKWVNIVIPNVWYSSKSKRVRKCLRDISLNTCHTHHKPQCIAMHEHDKNNPKYKFKMP